MSEPLDMPDAQGGWQPLNGYIHFSLANGHLVICDARSIDGLPFPDDVAICRYTAPVEGQPYIESLQERIAELERMVSLEMSQAITIGDLRRQLASALATAEERNKTIEAMEEDIEEMHAELQRHQSQPVEGQPVQADWLSQFPPEWDRHPWANYACLVASHGMHDGIRFMWYYWEVKPVWGEKSYNWVDGKWGFQNPVVHAPLSTFFNTRATLVQRPAAEAGA